jgi:hypothetical protein
VTRLKRIAERIGACGVVFLLLLFSLWVTKLFVDLISYRLLWSAVRWTFLVIMVSIVFGSFHYSKDCFMVYWSLYKNRKEYFANVRRKR